VLEIDADSNEIQQRVMDENILIWSKHVYYEIYE